jgi:hypothetical protein
MPSSLPRVPRASSPTFVFAHLFVVLLLLLSLACSRDTITREQWLTKTNEQKTLIVRSMLGGENAAEAKGGQGEKYSKDADYYRAEIDRRYATGDQRNVNEIWNELKD